MRAIAFLSFVTLACALAGCATDVQPSGEELRRSCGGFAGVACPTNYQCVDDTHDSCDPNRGGADCPGVCRRVRRDNTCNDPNRDYVSRDPDQCAAILYLCADGQDYFFDRCGCGCVDNGGGCVATALCIQGYTWDERTCSCVPATREACGTGLCPAGQVCCNDSCGICTEPGGFCTQQFCGTAL